MVKVIPLEDGSHRTAAKRKRPSAPMRWLIENGHVKLAHRKGRILDYGCGRGTDADWYGFHAWDPAWRPAVPKGTFDAITCIYVLNVLPKVVEGPILKNIRGLLKPGGRAYVAVRRDVPRHRVTKNGLQRQVRLDLPVLHEDAKFCIYEVRP
jgi:2-polyprenyl-3-methyl-5-hydroxy-6-metoxy-1,4-benzoquinol methylase